jgi:hypothetical protein
MRALPLTALVEMSQRLLAPDRMKSCSFLEARKPTTWQYADFAAQLQKTAVISSLPPSNIPRSGVSVKNWKPAVGK